MMGERYKVIGNEIWLDGYKVATIHEDEIPSTILGIFISDIEDTLLDSSALWSVKNKYL